MIAVPFSRGSLAAILPPFRYPAYPLPAWLDPSIPSAALPFLLASSQTCEGDTSPVPLPRLPTEAFAVCAACRPDMGSFLVKPWHQPKFSATASCREGSYLTRVRRR